MRSRVSTLLKSAKTIPFSTPYERITVHFCQSSSIMPRETLRCLRLSRNEQLS